MTDLAEIDEAREQAINAPAAKGLKESSLARVESTWLVDFPKDLYIPPHALSVYLDAFEGPLDFLLYLIRRQNMDIEKVNVAIIAKQYLHYIDLMRSQDLSLAADYLVMATFLVEVKSHSLLPKPPTPKEEDEQDPRALLIERLLEYEKYKQAAQYLSGMPLVSRDIILPELAWATPLEKIDPPISQSVSWEYLVEALESLLSKTLKKEPEISIQVERITTKDRMDDILDQLSTQKSISFMQCFHLNEGRQGVIAAFLALMELIRLGTIFIVKTNKQGRDQGGPIEPQQLWIICADQSQRESALE